MELRSPGVGKVLRLAVAVGAQVERGEEIMVIESMKVEIPIKENPRGIPHLWYVPLVGGENFFDGFGFDALRNDAHVKVDACGGPVSIRFFTTAKVSTDKSDDSVNTYGDILTL